jgi:hypothetical protein
MITNPTNTINNHNKTINPTYKQFLTNPKNNKNNNTKKNNNKYTNQKKISMESPSSVEYAKTS